MLCVYSPYVGFINQCYGISFLHYFCLGSEINITVTPLFCVGVNSDVLLYMRIAMRIPTGKYISGNTESPGFVMSSFSICRGDSDRPS